MADRPGGPVDLVLAGPPRTWRAASAKRIMPDAPMGLVDSTPPEGLTGRSPSSSVTPASVSFQPSPSPAKPRFSSHIGSYQEKGTYISTASISRRGSVIPACR
ncbi:hypothetical protein SMICM304S_11482 [Streptomyces microflavus]